VIRYNQQERKEREVVKMMMIDIELVCLFCGQVHTVTCSAAGFSAWQNGALIQNALPELSAEEREALISGICPDCQSDIFGEDEDE
jgi:Fe2+ or Zn2+ uptake regulation protein